MFKMSTYYLVATVLLFYFYRTGAEIVLRLYPNRTEHLEVLSALQQYEGILPIDFWLFPENLNDTADLMVSNHYLPELEKYLSKAKLPYKTQIESVEKLIKEERRTTIRRKRRAKRQTSSYNFFRYQDFNQMHRYLNTIANSSQYRGIVELFSIGKSREKRPLLVLKIGRNTGLAKPAIWIDGGIHAREWASPHTVMYFIHSLLTNYSTDQTTRSLVEKIDWYIAPLLNPDGYRFTWSSSSPYIRLWRKNRAKKQCIQWRRQEVCCTGVDLNRNFDAGWGKYGKTSAIPCQGIFHGEFPFSEPEAQAVRDFIMPHRRQFKAFLTIHTYSQLWLHSWGYAPKYYPGDIEDLRSVAVKATNAIRSVYGTNFQIGSGADFWYSASGSSKDWAKQIGIKYSYTLELRPEKGTENMKGFFLDRRELLPTAQETWEGVKVVAQTVIKEDSKSI